MPDEPDAQRLLRSLIGFPTVAGASNLELVAWLAERLHAAGAVVREVPSTRPDARNLWAVLGPLGEPGVLLAAHTDVVAVEGQRWTSDPFRLERRGDRLVGRGAADMKGFVAAVLAAVADGRPHRLRRPLQLAFSSDEELGCRGVPPLLDVLAAEAGPLALGVVGEPTGMGVVERHKGKLAFRAIVRGRAGHSSRPCAAVNAVSWAARAVGVLESYGERLATTGSDARFAHPTASLSVGAIHGGVAVNVVPERCTVEFEVRLLPDQDPGVTEQEVQAAVAPLAEAMRADAPEAGIELEALARYPGLAPLAGSGRPGAEVARLAGGDAGGTVDFGTEAGLYQNHLGMPVVVCGPGDMRDAHRPDEHLAVEQLDAAKAFVRRLLARLAA